MVHIIAIANQKGGVGKTTTAQNVGAELCDHGRRVLIVDCDPQASLTSAVGLNPTQLGRRHLYPLVKTIVDAGEIPDVAAAIWEMPTGEHILPATMALDDADYDIQRLDNGAFVLADLLDPVKDAYDIVLLDCRPSLSPLTTNALVAADWVLIPVTPEYLAAAGVERLLTTVRRIQRDKRLNPRLRVLGVVLTMAKARSSGQRMTEQEIRDYIRRAEIPILGSIRDAVVVADAPAAGVAVTRHPAGNGAAQDYRVLTAAILKVLGGSDA